MSDLRIVLAQIDTCVGDLAGNQAAVLAWTARAAAAGAQLVAFPEMTLTGYPIEDLALRTSFRRAAETTAQDTARDLEANGWGEITVVVGTVGLSADGRPTNQALVLHRGEVAARYDKHHLPNYGVFDEYRIFAPGAAPLVLTVSDHRVALAICEDIWIDGAPFTQAGEVDLLLVLNGSPFEQGKGHLRGELAARRAREVAAPVAYVNMVGGQDDLVFDGGSFVLTADGVTLARAPQFIEHLLIWDLPATDPPLDGVPRGGEIAPALDPDAEVYQAVVTGLRDYAVKNGFRSALLGLSGGIDSALVAAMAVDAMGAPNVYGVSMPAEHSSQHSRDDAADLAARTGLHYRTEPIGAMVGAFNSQLAPEGIAAENVQARVRGMILMTISNSEDQLVLATGNKSELATGYSTIYGDAVGGFAPLKDVDKSQVWALARWRNAAALDAGQVPPIPEASITKAPSAELRPGQVDQDSLPDYAVLDQVLNAYVEHGEGRDELLAHGFDPMVVDQVLTLVDRAEWKRRQYPPGPKVTALAFGRDRRLPITNSWREPGGATR